MITYSGIHIQTIGGADGTPTPMDIAVQSGRLCRFGGAIWYPLLPHLVFVGLMAFKRSNVLEAAVNCAWGFLHDGHETVTNDIPRPFKCDCMRKEQAAIDLRLIDEYFDLDAAGLIDFDMIKQCDLDACDIEAVTLEYPNYAQVTTSANTKGDNSYCHQLYAEKADVTLFRKVWSSHFFGDTRWPDSPGVVEFANVLTILKTRDLIQFRKRVESWGLL